MSIMCSILDPEKLNEYWPYFVPFIKPALEHEHGDLTMEKIYTGVANNTLLLIAVIDYPDNGQDLSLMAVQTMEIFYIDSTKICNLVTTSGIKLDTWQDELSRMIDTIARAEGCDVIYTRGRLGWLRQLKRNGYKPLYFVAEKSVKGAINEET